MAFGGFLALGGVPLPGIEIGIAISAIGLGFAVCLEAKPSLWIAALLVGVDRRQRPSDGGLGAALAVR